MSVGPVTSAPITPVLTFLLATAGALLLVTLCVAAALYRRRQARRRPTVKLESLDMDDALSHGAVLITPNNTAVLPPERRSPQDETDPDVIPNKYGESTLVHRRAGCCTVLGPLSWVRRLRFGQGSNNVFRTKPCSGHHLLGSFKLIICLADKQFLVPFP